MSCKIAIIGGGITGLSLANLLKGRRQTVVFEENEVGGKIKTQYYLHKSKNYFIELGPDSIIFEEQKIKKIEEFFPAIFDNKNFARNNPVYIFDGNHLKLLPTNLWEFFKTSLLTLDEKLLVFIDFLSDLFKIKNYDLNLTLSEYCNKRISSSFCKKVLEPLFSNIFGLPPDKLIIKFIYPLISKSFWRYKPVRMFNCKFGMRNWVDKLSNGIEIVKDKIVSIKGVDGKFKLKGIGGQEFDNFNKIVITGQAHNIIEIMKNIDFGDSLEKACSLRNHIICLLSKINFHSSFVDVFVLKKNVNLRANGVIFKNFDFVKSLTFFSKKWYDEYDIEVIRVFSNTEVFNHIMKDLKKFFGVLDYDFESNILEHFKIKWEKALVDYDKNFLENYEKLKNTCNELEKFGIYVFPSFIAGSNIIDRIIFSINNYGFL